VIGAFTFGTTTHRKRHAFIAVLDQLQLANRIRPDLADALPSGIGGRDRQAHHLFRADRPAITRFTKWSLVPGSPKRGAGEVDDGAELNDPYAHQRPTAQSRTADVLHLPAHPTSDLSRQKATQQFLVELQIGAQTC